MNPSPPSPDDVDEPTWQAQRDALRRLHASVLDEPMPAALHTAARQAAQRQSRQAGWLRWGGMAAGVLVAFGAGWLANAQWTGATSMRAQFARASGASEFVHAASIAHAVYSPEKRHPVEVAAAEQQHLVQWLSRRLDRPLRVPDLAAEGYTLVGGRLLPGDAGARAQFMFETQDGQRVTLYLGALQDKSQALQRGTESGFRYATEGLVPSFYWVDRGFGYALAGDLPRDTLMRLATRVYRQLEERPG